MKPRRFLVIGYPGGRRWRFVRLFGRYHELSWDLNVFHVDRVTTFATYQALAMIWGSVATLRPAPRMAQDGPALFWVLHGFGYGLFVFCVVLRAAWAPEWDEHVSTGNGTVDGLHPASRSSLYLAARERHERLRASQGS